MGSDDGPVMIGSVLSAFALAARVAFDAASWILGANLRVGRWFWRQAHFVLGALIAYFGGVALAVFLDVSPLAPVAMVSTLGWALFCPTEDLVWMRQRGYVSPPTSDLPSSRSPPASGSPTPPTSTPRTPPRRRNSPGSRETPPRPNPSRTSGPSTPRPPRTTRRTVHPRDDAIFDVSARRRRIEHLERRAAYHRARSRALSPLRLGVRALLRWQGLIREEDEARIALEAERSNVTGGASDERRRVGPPRRALRTRRRGRTDPCSFDSAPRDGGRQRLLAGWATRWGPETGGVVLGKAPPSAVDASCPEQHRDVRVVRVRVVRQRSQTFKGVGCPANPGAVKTKDACFRRKRCTFQVLVRIDEVARRVRRPDSSGGRIPLNRSRRKPGATYLVIVVGASCPHAG